MDEIQSWWEVPSIAHFCSLFRAAFDLFHFDIEELEEALITDATDEGSQFLADLVVRLLRGCYGRKDIDDSNYNSYLTDIMKHRWEVESHRHNPMQDKNFKDLSFRIKVEILHALCDYRLDADDVMEVLKGLESEKMRIEPLGTDDGGVTYWYFYGTRLYKEDPRPTAEDLEDKRKESEKERRKKEKEKRKKKNKKSRKREKKKKSKLKKKKTDSSSDKDSDEEAKVDQEADDEKPVVRWSVACSTEEEWIQFTDSFKKSKSANERALYKTLVKDFLPEIPGLFLAKERALKKKLLEMVPRRTSGRIEQKRQQKEEEVNLFPYDRLITISTVVENEHLLVQDDEQRRLQQLADEESQRRHREERQQAREERARRAKLREERISLLSQGKELPNDKFNHKALKKQPKKRKKSVIYGELEELYVGLFKVLEVVQSHPDVWPFQDPVQESYAPGYYNVIKQPMDLSAIEKKLGKRHYGSKQQFMKDFQLMFNNCQKYNGPENEYTEMAQTLEKCFLKALTKHFPTEETDDEYSSCDDKKPRRENRPKREASLRAIEALTQVAEEAFKDNSPENFTDDIESPYPSTRSQTTNSPQLTTSQSNSPVPMTDKAKVVGNSVNLDSDPNLIAVIKPKAIVGPMENNSISLNTTPPIQKEEEINLHHSNINSSKYNYVNSQPYSSSNISELKPTKPIKEPLERLKLLVSNPPHVYSQYTSQRPALSQGLPQSPFTVQTTQGNQGPISQFTSRPYSSTLPANANPPKLLSSVSQTIPPPSLSNIYPSKTIKLNQNISHQNLTNVYPPRTEALSYKNLEQPVNLSNSYSSGLIQSSSHPVACPKQQNTPNAFSEKTKTITSHDNPSQLLSNGQSKSVESIIWSKMKPIMTPSHQSRNLLDSKPQTFQNIYRDERYAGNRERMTPPTSSIQQIVSQPKDFSRSDKSDVIRQQQNRASVIQGLPSYSSTLQANSSELNKVRHTVSPTTVHSPITTQASLIAFSRYSDMNRTLSSSLVQPNSYVSTMAPNRIMSKKESFDSHPNNRIPYFKAQPSLSSVENNQSRTETKIASSVHSYMPSSTSTLSIVTPTTLPSQSVLSYSNPSSRNPPVISKSNESHIELPAKKRKLADIFFEENKNKIWRPGLESNRGEINGMQSNVSTQSLTSQANVQKRAKPEKETKCSENHAAKETEIKENSVNNRNLYSISHASSVPARSNHEMIPRTVSYSLPSMSVPQTIGQTLLTTVPRLSNEGRNSDASRQLMALEAAKKRQQSSQPTLAQSPYMIHVVDQGSSGVQHSIATAFDPRLGLQVTGMGPDHPLYQQYIHQHQQELHLRVHQEQMLYQQQLLSKPLPAHYHPQFIPGTRFLEPKHLPPVAHSQQQNLYSQAAYFSQLRNGELNPAFYSSLSKPH